MTASEKWHLPAAKTPTFLQLREFQRLFFAFYQQYTAIMPTGEKAAPSVASHNTQQSLRISTSKTRTTSNQSDSPVRWPGKTRGALVFALNFWFFWFKPKEQKESLDFFCYILSEAEGLHQAKK